jgi:hypothetical protein
MDISFQCGHPRIRLYPHNSAQPSRSSNSIQLSAQLHREEPLHIQDILLRVLHNWRSSVRWNEDGMACFAGMRARI